MTKPYPPPDSGVPGPANRPRRPQPPGGRGRTRSAGKGVEQETGSYSQRTRDGGGDTANASSQPISNPAGRGARFFALGGEGPERPRRPCSLPRARRAGGDPETSPAPRAPSPARSWTRERSAAGRGGAPSGEGGAQGRAGGAGVALTGASSQPQQVSSAGGSSAGALIPAPRHGPGPGSPCAATRLPPPEVLARRPAAADKSPARVVPRGCRSAPAAPRPRPALPAPHAPELPSVPAPGIRPTSRPAPLPHPLRRYPPPRAPGPSLVTPVLGSLPPDSSAAGEGCAQGGRAGPAQLGGRGGRESDSGGTHFGVRDRPLLVSLLNNLKTPKKVAGRACGLPWKPLELVGATENLEKDAWSAS